MQKKISLLGEELKAKTKQVYSDAKRIICRHLWLEVLFMIGLAACVAGGVFLIVSHFIYSIGFGEQNYISYHESRAYIQEMIFDKAAYVNEIAINLSTEEEIEDAVSEAIDRPLEDGYVCSSQTYLVDGTGKVIYPKGTVESLNIPKVIEKANNNEYSQAEDEFIAIYPVLVNNQVCYLYNESKLEPSWYTEFTSIGNIIALITAIAMFILIIFRLTRDKIAYIEYLSACLDEISKGNLEYDIEVVGKDELARVAQSITHMENELKYQIEAQIAAEKSKNELVTNVAHDLRTPLTSIIGYIGLVKTKITESEDETLHKYLEVAYNKSEKLKIIIEDLFELTKFHQGKIVLKKTEVSLGNLINQLVEELMPLAQEKNIEIETYIDTGNTNAIVDAGKITRVFENLIENAIKYSLENETIYVELRSVSNKVYVAVSNPSQEVTQEEIDKYFERFYRADQARSSAGGSGLGLAIAKNIVELHQGLIEAKLYQDLICFKVVLPR